MSVGDEIAKLKALRDQGVLTDPEYEEQKARVLAGAPAPAADIPVQSKKSSSAAKGCGVILLVLVVLAIIGAVFGDKKAGVASNTAQPAADASTAATAEVDAADAATKVTVTQLFNAYDNNEAAAQRAFDGRSLLVTGTLDKVDLDMFDKPELLLKTPNQFMSAHADLVEADQSKAADLRRGQPVTLLCDKVSEVMSIPMLKDCQLR
jgi:hypothetical protein